MSQSSSLFVTYPSFWLDFGWDPHFFLPKSSYSSWLDHTKPQELPISSCSFPTLGLVQAQKKVLLQVPRAWHHFSQKVEALGLTNHIKTPGCSTDFDFKWV